MSASADRYPRLLCVTGPEGQTKELVLDLAEWRYDVRQDGDLWIVKVRGVNQLVYAGPGPVEVRGAPLSFVSL
jgi:hypothetical protein